MNKQREAMQFALETPKEIYDFGKMHANDAIQHEPVAWVVERAMCEPSIEWYKPKKYLKCEPLYAAPPARKSLTDEEIDNLELPPNGCTMRELVRVVERAHGIGDE